MLQAGHLRVPFFFILLRISNMPKVIYTLPLVGTLDNMVFEALHSGDEPPRHLSPELTDEQVEYYLSIPGFVAHDEQDPAPGKKEGVVADIPPAAPAAAGGDGTLKPKAAKKSAAKKEPKPAHRETPAERKARLAAEADGSK